MEFMTEDDTFNALRRTPYDVMVRMGGISNKVIRANGWTPEEYLSERYNNRTDTLKTGISKEDYILYWIEFYST